MKVWHWMLIGIGAILLFIGTWYLIKINSLPESFVYWEGEYGVKQTYFKEGGDYYFKIEYPQEGGGVKVVQRKINRPMYIAVYGDYKKSGTKIG